MQINSTWRNNGQWRDQAEEALSKNPEIGYT
jgi:hypothetical protein